MAGALLTDSSRSNWLLDAGNTCLCSSSHGPHVRFLLEITSKLTKMTAIANGRYKTQVTGHRSGHRAQVTGHRAQGTGHRSQVTGHRSQGTGHRSQVTGHRAQGTGHRAQVIGHRKRNKNS